MNAYCNVRVRFLRPYLRGLILGLIRCHLGPHHPLRARCLAAPPVGLRHPVPEPLLYSSALQDV